jgi:hypothetical protein
MTEPSPARPVPGPPRPVPGPGPADVPHPAESDAERKDRFADLDELPVAQHVAVFESEHDRLQRELGTIDQL